MTAPHGQCSGLDGGRGVSGAAGIELAALPSPLSLSGVPLREAEPRLLTMLVP